MTASDRKKSPKMELPVDKFTQSSESYKKEANKKDEKVEKRPFNWLLVLYFLYLHLLAPYAIYLAITDAMYTTSLYTIFCVVFATLGVTAGSHRLWTHRSYKADTKLRVFLMLAQTLSGHGSIYNWVLHHRKHHKFLGTNKDPFNISRGFIYTHLLSNMEKATEIDEEASKEIDMSDIEEDKVVMFQKKYYWYIFFFVAILLPINAPMEYWGESTINAIFSVILFHTIALHTAWLVNSSILVWGLQPNDKYPADTNLVFLITKSYWPQYHHLTPWDYQCGEFGSYGDGSTTTFIRVCAAIGWATGLRTIDSESVKKAVSNSLNSDLSIEKCLETEADAHTKQLENHYLYRNLA